MTDDLISKAPIQDISSTDPDTENSDTEDSSVRVFDITPDLNISPAKDEVETPAPTTVPGIVIKEELIPTNKINLDRKPIPPQSQTIAATFGTSNPSTATSNTTKPQTTFTTTNRPASTFGPANPPTKTIGPIQAFLTKTIDPNISTANQILPAASLQDAVSAIADETKIFEKPSAVKNSPNVKPIRTYESDIAEAMSKRHLSTSSFIIAEDKKKELEKNPVSVSSDVQAKEIPKAPINTAQNTVSKIPIEKISNVSKAPIENINKFSAETILNNATKIPTETVSDIAKIAENPEIVKSAELLRNSQIPESANPYVKSHSTRNFLLSIFSLILICGGIFALYYLYSQSALAPVASNSTSSDLPDDSTPAEIPAESIPPKATPIKKEQPPVVVTNPVKVVSTTKSNVTQTQFSLPIISADFRAVINSESANQTKLISSIRTEISKDQKENSIKEIILTKTVNNKLERITANEIIGTAKITPPDIFGRSLAPSWMLGVYAGTNGQKNAFVVITNDFFQNAFAGIIQWEKNMPEDLKYYLGAGSISTNNASSSLSDFTLKGQYKDRIIRNKDVREYVAENGHIIFLYSFISNDKLVITNSEEALQEIILRLEKSAFVR